MLYNTKTVANRVDSVKNTEIKQYEKTIQKALSKYDIELAKQETKKLKLLSQDKAKKYYEDIQTTEEELEEIKEDEKIDNNQGIQKNTDEERDPRENHNLFGIGIYRILIL